VDLIDQWVDGFIAVLDSSGVEAAWLLGQHVMGGPFACRLAARYPERLSGATVLNPPGGPLAHPVNEMLSRDGESNKALLHEYMPGRADDPAYRAWHERAGRLGGSASAARAFFEIAERMTPRILNEPDQIADPPPPFLIIRRRERIHPAVVDFWCERLPGAEVTVLEGADDPVNAVDSVLVADTMGAFITGRTVASDGEDRQLMALLYLDLVSSTEKVASVGDDSWMASLDTFEHNVEKVVVRHGGSVVKHVGDGTLATFPTGSRAIAAAVSIRETIADLELTARLGVHVGEVESRGDDIGGVAVHLAARVMAEAEPDQILATSTLVESIDGAAYRFESVGARELKGIERPRILHSVVVE
jgi:class 3 adenylate cyclase